MKIIPVIDLHQGQVVHARGGARADYLPIRSRLCGSSDPFAVVEALLDLHSYDHLYVADLDAIQGTGDHRTVLDALCRLHPNLICWVDAGLGTAAAVSEFARLGPGSPVVGSESLPSGTAPDVKAWAEDVVLSLDFRDQALLGPADLLKKPQYWPADVIVMELARVGRNQGPNLQRIANLRRQISGHRLYAAGGVRGADDLASLDDGGVAGVLIASALHDGSIDATHLARYC